MHLILTGATGLVGSGALHTMLMSPAVTKISILSRRSVKMVEDLDKTSKVDVIIHSDFKEYSPEVLERLKGAEGCIWALGVSQTDVPDKDQYTKITATYPLAAAAAFATLPTPPSPFKFIYVSGDGATTTPSALTPLFGRVKGQAEAALIQLSKTTAPNLRLFSVRPGGIDAHSQPEIWPYVVAPKGMLLRLGNAMLLPVARTMLPGLLCPTRELGVFMLGLAMGDGMALEGKGITAEGRTVSNGAIRRLTGLK